MPNRPTIRIGLISDTHGLLRPEAVAMLQGVHEIWHAGDIGKPQILESLNAVAPVYAVRGNNDMGDWASSLDNVVRREVAGISLYMVHDLAELRLDPRAEKAEVVITGHSHRPLIREEGGVVFVNPGSAGPRRFRLPISIAFLDIQDGRASAQIAMLDIPQP